MDVHRESSVVLLQDPPLPVTEQHRRRPSAGRRLKAAVAGLVWLGIGGAVIAYGSALVYANVARIEADSAVVSGVVESIQAPSAGRLSLALAPGAEFARGDKLFTVTDPELEERIGLASVRVERARSDLKLKQAELEAERARRDNFLVTLRADIDRVKTEIVALLELERNAQRRLEATRELYTKGFVTRPRLEDVSDRAAETKSNVARARASEQEKAALLAAVSAGRGYGGQGGLGRLDDFHAAVARADAEVKLAIEEMQVFMQRRAATRITATSAGRVLRVLKHDGAPLQSGDAVALFQRDDERVIHAFLTQAEVSRVSIGDEAEVYLPAQRLTARARVAGVERSGGYLDDVESRYGWRSLRDSGVRHTDRDRTARVTLRFSDADRATAKRELDPGTPAVVSFQRRWEGTQVLAAYTTLEQLAGNLSSKLASVGVPGAHAP